MRVNHFVCYAALMLLFFQPAFALYDPDGRYTGSPGVVSPSPVGDGGVSVINIDNVGGGGSPVVDPGVVLGAPLIRPPEPSVPEPTAPPVNPPDPPQSTPLPAPAAPKSLTPEQIKMFSRQAEEVRLVYQRILNNLEADGKKAEVAYFNKVAWCEKTYAGYQPHLIDKRNICNKEALDAFEATVERLKKAMEGAKVAYQQAIANLKEAFAKEAGVEAEQLPETAPLVAPAPVETPAPSTSTSPATPAPATPSPAPATPAPSTSTTTTNNTTNNTTVNNTTVQQDIKFEDLNDFADYCKANPASVSCMKVGEVPSDGGDWGEIWETLKNNGSPYSPKPFSFERYLGGGSRLSCPAPLSFTVQGYSVNLSFDLLCRFLELIRGVVIVAATVVTGMFVLKGIK